MERCNRNLISKKAYMSSKRVFILGAGFSKMAGMPLATDLTNHLGGKFREDDLKDALEWLDYLQQRIEWLGDGSGVKILKMHGSINWIMVPREQKDNFGYPLLFEKTQWITADNTNRSQRRGFKV